MATEEPVPTTRGQTILMHLRRGATVMTTDGALGTLHQIIMDEHTGELQALVISTGGVEYLEVPATHVLRATDSDVYLDVSQTDLRLHPELVKPYNPDQYTPVRENPLLAPSEASRGAQFRERPVV
ncbi:MAG TPA: PRC-barrel domain-containing protein, partial [Ktedonobacterales bacterium]|nr:PRC-barrel domain-containing protein [Ktedonobacterales bacterium]